MQSLARASWTMGQSLTRPPPTRLPGGSLGSWQRLNWPALRAAGVMTFLPYSTSSDDAITDASTPARDARHPPFTTMVKRNLQWLLAKSLGFILCIPLGVKLAANWVFRPGKSMASVGWSEAAAADPLPDLTHEWVTVNGVRLHLVRTCTNHDGCKPVLLLLHGFPEGWFSWRHQMEALRGEWCVAALDMRGYGGSDKPQGVANYRIEELVGDVAAVIRTIAPPGSNGVALAAHDWGGVVAWHVAHMHPELVERLAIMCAPHPACYRANLDWDQMKRSWYILAFLTPWIPEAALCWGAYDMIGGMLRGREAGCRNPEALSKEDIQRYKQEFARPGVATAALNYYRAYVDSATRDPNLAVARAVRQKLAMPALVLWADHDIALGPQLLRGMEQYVEQLRVHMVKDSSHWVQQDRWEEVNRWLQKFLNEGAC